ncbi:hypothetical protein ACG02S_11345 [Roseateles sp. DC23W]|uniref:Uncharacterized protein n=1 Tax=Pelomonas dachongensis TaxID=3299029 RepID=A0ABW7ENN1_9BURK
MYSFHRSGVVLLGLSLCGGAAWALTPDSGARPVVAVAQQAVITAGIERAAQEDALKRHEQAVLEADQALATQDPSQIETLRDKREHALKARRQLALTAKAKADADAALAKASAALYLATENLLACAAQPADCPGGTAPVLTASQYNAIAVLGAQAMAAQEALGAAEAAAAQAVKVAAAAEDTVRERVAQRNQQPGAALPVVAPDVQHAQQATAQAKQSQQALKPLQAGIQRVSAKAVAWAACQPGQPCAGFSAEELAELETQAFRLKGDIDAVKDQSKMARGNGYWLDERITSVSSSKQKGLVDLLVRLDDLPDAQSLFGSSDAARLSASASGAEATIRLDLNRIPGALTRDTRLIISAPKGSDGRGRLIGFRNADQVVPSVQWVRDITRDVESFGSWGEALYVFGVNAKLGYSEHTYRSRDKLDDEQLARNTPKSLGVQLAVAGLEKQRFHVLRANYAEAYKEAPVETICPAAPLAGQTWLSCVDASFAAPERQRGWVFGYEYRVSWKHAAVSMGFQYDRRIKRKIYSLPIYLLRDSDNKDKPFTGGLSLDYKTRSTLHPKRSFEVGVFVGAPFSLFSR